MSAHLFRTPEEFRLRRTDNFQYPSELLTDEDATLEFYGVQNGDFFWLEEGKVFFFCLFCFYFLFKRLQ